VTTLIVPTPPFGKNRRLSGQDRKEDRRKGRRKENLKEVDKILYSYSEQ
jgi:hypothetical protein